MQILVVKRTPAIKASGHCCPERLVYLSDKSVYIGWELCNRDLQEIHVKIMIHSSLAHSLTHSYLHQESVNS